MLKIEGYNVKLACKIWDLKFSPHFLSSMKGGNPKNRMQRMSRFTAIINDAKGPPVHLEVVSAAQYPVLGHHLCSTKCLWEQTNTIQNVTQQVLEREFLSSVFLVCVFVEYLSKYFDVDHLVNSERRLPFTLLKVVHGGFYGTRQRSTNTRNWRNRINYSQTDALQIATQLLDQNIDLQIFRSTVGICG